MILRAQIVLAFTALLAVTVRLPAAQADDDWEDRWEDYQERLEDAREDRAEALEDYWEHQRDRQRRQYRRHAWYGSVDPYYPPPSVSGYYPAYRAPGTYYGAKPFAGYRPGYYNDCIGPHCGYGELRSYGRYGGDCHDEIRGRVSIGPVTVFWD